MDGNSLLLHRHSYNLERFCPSCKAKVKYCQDGDRISGFGISGYVRLRHIGENWNSASSGIPPSRTDAATGPVSVEYRVLEGLDLTKEILQKVSGVSAGLFRKDDGRVGNGPRQVTC
jgi:hypothetical protein